MVQAVSSNGADQAFNVGVLPGTPRGGEYFFMPSDAIRRRTWLP